MSYLSRAGFGLALGFVAALTLHDMSPAFGQDRTGGANNSNTLSYLFPDLINLPNTTALTLRIGWYGLSRFSPRNASYSLNLRNNQFEGDGKFKLAWASAARTIAIPRELVQPFFATANKVEMIERQYVPRFTHTDDYPSIGVEVQTLQGALKIWTASQPEPHYIAGVETYEDRAPWAIEYLGRTFVVTTSDLDQAIHPLEQFLRTKDDEVFKNLADRIISADPSFCVQLLGDGATADAAITACTGAIASNKYSGRNLATFYGIRGSAYLIKGDNDHAIADLSEAIRLDPANANNFYPRCRARALDGKDLNGALADCNESLRSRPNNGYVLNSRGLVEFKLGAFDAAISDYNAAVAQNAKDADSLYARGVAKLKNGDTAGGNADIAAAKAIKPNIAAVSAGYGITVGATGANAESEHK
jgi:tetratricopeptide (TPR) repeat protein